MDTFLIIVCLLLLAFSAFMIGLGLGVKWGTNLTLKAIEQEDNIRMDALLKQIHKVRQNGA